MARYSGMQWLAFNIDDQKRARFQRLMRKNAHRIETGDRRYQVLPKAERVETSGLFLEKRYRKVSQVRREDSDEQLSSDVLIEFAPGPRPNASHWIRLPDLPEMELRPHPPGWIPDRFDILVEGELRGCVAIHGKWMCRCVVVVIPDVPESFRNIIALLLHHQLGGNVPIIRRTEPLHRCVLSQPKRHPFGIIRMQRCRSNTNAKRFHGHDRLPQIIRNKR